MVAPDDYSTDAYIAVARYPFLAQNVRLTSSSQPVIEWDYPQFHNETKGYHVYRSRNSLTDFVEITTSAIDLLIH